MAARVRFPVSGADFLFVAIERCKDGAWWNGSAFVPVGTPAVVPLAKIQPGLVGSIWQTPEATWGDGEYAVYPCLVTTSETFLAIDARYAPARFQLTKGDDAPPPPPAASPGVTFVLPPGVTIVPATAAVKP